MTKQINPSERAEATAQKRRLPGELDNETVIFAYGSLLEHEKLRELLTKRGEFKILETGHAAEAAQLVKDHPKDIVILKNVRLENVRVSIVTETMLRRWYARSGGDLEALRAAGLVARETRPAVFLMGRPAKPEEKGRTLNGGLICNLSKEELSLLDRYEWTPVLKRVRAPKLKIGKRAFVPEQITFYAGAESTGDITREEKAERSRLLNLNRKPGGQSPQARWQRGVRRQ